MPSRPNDYDTKDVELIVGAHASLDMVVGRYLDRCGQGSFGEFEVPLSITGGEVRQLLQELQVGDMFVPPGGYIGSQVHEEVGILNESEAKERAGQRVLRRLAAYTFRVSTQPTEIAIIGYRKRMEQNAAARSLLAISMYYDQGEYDGQQIIGLHTRPDGITEAVRFEHIDHGDTRLHTDTVIRQSTPAQTFRFASRARDFLQYCNVTEI
jgi:hypothetical protein